MRSVLRVLIASAAIMLASGATRAAAYDSQITLDASAGWGLAPVLEAPNNGPAWALGATYGFDDTWGFGAYASWSVHPAFNAGSPLHVGVVGVEGLYYIDILQVVPFFGLGLDVLPTFDEATGTWGADFAVHVRASIDYLVSREIAIGVDVRPYVLFTALVTAPTNPIYLTFFARLSVILEQ